MDSFRNNDITRGLDDSHRHSSHTKEHQHYLEQVYEQVAPRLLAAVPNSEQLLPEPLFGNPNVHQINGDPVNISNLDRSYFTSQIYPFLAGQESPTIVEIGGGWGGLARNLKLVKPNSKLILFDLPSANFQSTYFLSKAFPQKHFFSLTDLTESGVGLNNLSDFAVLPSWKIQDLPDGSVDMVINTRSMMEMELPVIDYFISHVKRILTSNGVFYFANRYTKLETKLYRYNFGRGWAIRHSKHLPKQPHIHELILQRSANPAIALWVNLPWNYFKFSDKRVLLHDMAAYLYSRLPRPIKRI